jgi:hypothetical protein
MVPADVEGRGDDANQLCSFGSIVVPFSTIRILTDGVNDATYVEDKKLLHGSTLLVGVVRG